LQVDGGLATTAPFDLQVFVIPGDGYEYVAEAYHCDSSNNRQDDVPPISIGESVRICISPTEEAKNLGIRINSIDSFNFTRGRSNQLAVEGSNGPKESQTVVMCDPGSEVCVFRTVLVDDFFGSMGSANGDGLVSLQFSVNGQTSVSRRRLQAADEEEDVYMAGQSSVNVETLLAVRPVGSDLCAFEDKFTEWWLEEDTGSQALYIGIICGTAISTLLCLLCCWLCPPFLFRRRDDRVTSDENEVRVNVDVKKETDSTIQQKSIVDNQQNVPVQSSEGFLLPGEFDIVFGDEERPGTKMFLGHVNYMAKKNPDETYSPFIYRKIKKPFVNCTFYKRDIEGQFSKPEGEDLVGLIGKAYADAINARRRGTMATSRSKSGRTATTAPMTETGSSMESSRSHKSRSGSDRSLYTVGSFSCEQDLGSSSPTCYPNEGDIVFDDSEHQGTRRLLERVQSVAKKFPFEEYSPHIYREIKAPFERRQFYIMTGDGSHRRATKSECVGLIGKSFGEAKMTLRSLHSPPIRGPIHADSGYADDISTIGEGTAMLSAKVSRSAKSRGSSASSVRSLKNIDGDNVTRKDSNRSIRSFADSEGRSVKTKRRASSGGTEKTSSRKVERRRAESSTHKEIPSSGGNDSRPRAGNGGSMRSVNSTGNLSEMDRSAKGGKSKRRASMSDDCDGNSERPSRKSLRSVKSASNLSEVDDDDSRRPKMSKRKSSGQISVGDESSRVSKRTNKSLPTSNTNLQEMDRRRTSAKSRCGDGSMSQSGHSDKRLSSKKGKSGGSKKLKRSRSTGQIVDEEESEAPSSSSGV
jgi:hypothetical protein